MRYIIGIIFILFISLLFIGQALVETVDFKTLYQDMKLNQKYSIIDEDIGTIKLQAHWGCMS